jgi:hypothetical protein
MKATNIFVLAFAVALYCAPAVAQHGHMGGGMGHNSAMSHNSSANSGPSAAQGKTMDQILTKNTQLASKIKTLTGMSAQQACSGFKNLGQCVAAAHVSKNLGINFACMKSAMTGTAAPSGTSCGASTNTSSKSMSLGKAIQTLSPTANSRTEARKGTKQAQQDLNQS